MTGVIEKLTIDATHTHWTPTGHFLYVNFLRVNITWTHITYLVASLSGSESLDSAKTIKNKRFALSRISFLGKYLQVIHDAINLNTRIRVFTLKSTRPPYVYNATLSRNVTRQQGKREEEDVCLFYSSKANENRLTSRLDVLVCVANGQTQKSRG